MEGEEQGSKNVNVAVDTPAPLEVLVGAGIGARVDEEGRPRTRESGWLQRFHAGERDALDSCYREHFSTVARAVSATTSDAIDRESLIHDVFARLFADEGARRGFGGGSFAAWISTVAKNRARDALRRQKREQVVEPEEIVRLTGHGGRDPVMEGEARDLLATFQRDVLPEKWAGVFVARFVEQRDQRDAAQRLGLARTTLLYREHRVRRLLERFLRAQNPGGLP